MTEEQTGGGIVDGIDLYADVDNDFPTEDVAANESGDLYDDVLTSNVGNEDEKKTDTSSQEPTNHNNSQPLVSPTSTPGVILHHLCFYQFHVCDHYIVSVIVTYWT